MRERLAFQERIAQCPARVLAESAQAKADEIQLVLRMRGIAEIKRQKRLARAKARQEGTESP